MTQRKNQLNLNTEDYVMVKTGCYEKLKEKRMELIKEIRIMSIVILALIGLWLVTTISLITINHGLNTELNNLRSECEELKEESTINNVEIDTIEVPEQITETEIQLPEKFDKVPLDDNLKEYIYNSAIEADIPAEIMFALAWKESTFDPNVKSATGDHGLFQINAINFDTLSKAFGYSVSELSNKIYDPYVNTDCAIYILKDYRDNYNNDNWHHVLMRYNMGPNATDNLFEMGKYSSEYSREILTYAERNFNFTNITID